MTMVSSNLMIIVVIAVAGHSFRPAKAFRPRRHHIASSSQWQGERQPRFDTAEGRQPSQKKQRRRVQLANSLHQPSETATSTSSSPTASTSPTTASPSNTQLSAASLSLVPSSPSFKIFCDLDGVLVDFCKGVEDVCGARPEHISKQRMWRSLSTERDFYTKLPWMEDGKRLWDAIKHIGPPDILTGVPTTKRSRTEKAKWCRKELGVPTNHVDVAGPRHQHVQVSGQRQPGVTNVITCWSFNKHNESRERAVLIDDRLDLGREWMKKGGIFIHHVSTEQTLRQLREHGIIGFYDDETQSDESRCLH